MAEKMGLKHYSDGREGTFSQEGQKNKKRAGKKGEVFVEKHVVVKNT